jgi:proline iminopeptidase
VTPDPAPAIAREGWADLPHARLFVREIGQGQPVIVLHGGPDFDHGYLLPDLDRLAGGHRLIYYDQRGRGRSTGDLEAITLQTEVEDLDGLRRHLGLETAALLGHSWGAVLALAYALRHAAHVSRLVLMNPAPASSDGLRLTRQAIARQLAPHEARMRELRASAAFQAGDPAAAAAYYRLWFSAAFARPEHLERLDLGYGRCAAEDVRRARACEDRLYEATYRRDGWSLLPELARLRVPALVLTGEHDFIPPACAREIAAAIPGARRVELAACGHFAYLECPEAAREVVEEFLA